MTRRKMGGSGSASGSPYRRLQALLVLPIAVVLGLLAFTAVGASAPPTPAQAAPPAQEPGPSVTAPSSHRADTSSSAPSLTAGLGAATSDPRFDLAANPASSQYCPHADHPPPCGGGGHGAASGGKPKGGASSGSPSVGTTHPMGAATSTTGPTALSAKRGASLPFTGEDVLVVILLGLLLTETGLALAARASAGVAPGVS